MAYTATNWQDNVTWVDATRMNNIESGIQEQETTNEANSKAIISLKAQLETLSTQETNNQNLLDTLQSAVNAMQATTSAVVSLPSIQS